MGQTDAETRSRVAMTVSRGLVALADDDKKMQQLQVRLLSNETKDKVEHFQPYGFTSVPKVGAEHVTVFLGGGRDHGIVLVADDRRYRLRSLKSGDVALYTDEGTKIVLGRDRTITVESDTVNIKTKSFKVDCETLELSASTSVKVTSPSVDVNES